MLAPVPWPEHSVDRREWTVAERRVVWNGFLGRLSIAMEPVIVGSVFLAIVVALVRLQREDAPALILAPIFGLGFVAFAAYAVALMVEPCRALSSTFEPILIVDGYVRYRSRPGMPSEPNHGGYVAVLAADGTPLGEWPTSGKYLLPLRIVPAHVEFNRYAGILRIDGCPTGLLPHALPALGIGTRIAD
jgi:hypothetical protein